MRNLKLLILLPLAVIIFLFGFKITASAATQEEIDDLESRGYTILTDDGQTVRMQVPNATCTNQVLTFGRDSQNDCTATNTCGTGEVPPGSYCDMCGCTSCVYAGGNRGYACNGDVCNQDVVTPTITPKVVSDGSYDSKYDGVYDGIYKPSKTPTPRVSNTPTPTRKPSVTPTITPTRAPSNTPTPRPSNTPTPTSSPTPTFTPTPTPFNPAACTCDGITYTDIKSGQPLTVTSFGKVTGPDTSKAQIVDQTFFLAEGAETTAKIIARSNPIPASVVSNSSSLVRYQSVWNLTMPTLKSGSTYRIWSQINCQPKLTSQVAVKQAKNHAVLAAETKSSSVWDLLLAPIRWIFGGNANNVQNAATPTPAQASVANVTEVPTGNPNLQLGTIQPVEVYQKTCSFIKFRYNFNQ